jgi:hypothetical protein
MLRYTNTRWKLNGGINLYVCANAGPVYGCRTPGDPCVDNAAGLANLLYPPLDGLSMKPVSSVRWELLAIGLQDVEGNDPFSPTPLFSLLRVDQYLRSISTSSLSFSESMPHTTNCTDSAILLQPSMLWIR